jgi:alkylation response protein AidB-like acyl-CoA dehydrogenase
MAKLFACSTFRDITAMAQQLFGGIGFTLDFDIQLYFRRAKAWPAQFAEPAALYARAESHRLSASHGGR